LISCRPMLCLHRRGLLDNAGFSVAQLVDTQVCTALNGMSKAA